MKPPTGGPTTGPISAGTVSQASEPTSSRLRDAAQDDQAPDRHHHRPADALDDAGERPCRRSSCDRPQRIEPTVKVTIASRKIVRAP